ncbi:hypothetical protein SAMN02910370_02208 [Lachnospiraceae bacterium XPB1003]|nr:hypothetical protein SAMN02910370_02208 [Lachnospiraceae bacterium XPB1003]
MEKNYIYRCSKGCPIGKKCFLFKVTDIITTPMKMKQKCMAQKKEILLTIAEGSEDFLVEKSMEVEDE